MANASSNIPQILRLKQVKEITGLSRSSIYAAMGKVDGQKFPQQIRITSKTVGWLADEVYAFVMSRVAQSRTPVGKEVA